MLLSLSSTNRIYGTYAIFAVLVILILTRLFLICSGDLLNCSALMERGEKETLTGKYCPICNKYRQNIAVKIRSILPSPHSELLLGTTLGINDLKTIPRFNDVLVSTGTIHVVVVSGYNISLVFNHVSNLLKKANSKTRLFITQIIAVIYALMSGFEPPVLRALLMVSVIFWVRFLGRNVNITAVLLLTGLVMLAFNPLYLFDLSFQLSFMATLGLVLFSDLFETYLSSYLGENVVVSDFCASLSAQILVTPLISHAFGRISLLSALVNSIVLWLIPLITSIGMLAVIGILIHKLVGKIFVLVLLPFSLLFVNILEFVDKIFSITLPLQISKDTLIMYYMLVGVIAWYSGRKPRNKETE